MALDKQKILSELGSVMTKLQSADCGCMGKLFSNQNQGQEGTATANRSPDGGFGGYGGCRHGCCHGHGGFNFGHGVGFSSPGAGEPYESNGSCMGKCNPRKMYADTYNYLNQNLMQPTVKEVYDDLKSITPENTVMNNTMAGTMGMSQRGNPMQGGSPTQAGNSMLGVNNVHGENIQDRYNWHEGTNGKMGMHPNMMANNMGSYTQGAMHGNMDMVQNQGQENGLGMPQHQMQGAYEMNLGMSQRQMHGDSMGNHMAMSTNNLPVQEMTNQKMAHMMGGMGPQIVNMMKSDTSAKPVSPSQGGQMPSTMLNEGPQSSLGTQGYTPLSTTGEINHEQYNYKPGMYYDPNQQMHPPMTQYMTDNKRAHETNSNVPTNITNTYNNNYAVNANLRQNLPHSSPIQTSSRPNDQQMGMANRSYGQHTQGIKKFNEMFPGVIGADLGFDPMAIAIQMNPANTRKAAMDTMQKIMGGNRNQMQTGAANTSLGNTTQPNQLNVPLSSQHSIYGQFGSAGTLMAQNELQGIGNTSSATIPAQQNQIPQQVYHGHQVLHKEMSETNQEPVNTAHTEAGKMELTQPLQQNNQVPQQQYQQQHIDPNTGVIMPQTIPNLEAIGDTNAPVQQQITPEANQIMFKDPIFPADTSRFQPPPYMRRAKTYQYNTLGQAVEMLPGRLFHSNPETNLPQTLSPQPETGKLRKDIDRFHVKSTVSKTSLMANRPVGKVPSRNQLQNIYNQYKGSQSATQQRVRAPDQGGSFSAGKIIQQGNFYQDLSVPVERVGGDTVTNNQAMHEPNRQTVQHIGDVPVETNKPQGDIISTKMPQESPIKSAACRNGLQDMTYTTYPSSGTAWSFHGNATQRVPHSSYRYRNRA